MTDTPRVHFGRAQVQGGRLDGATAGIVELDRPPALLVIVPQPPPDPNSPGAYVDASCTSPAGYSLTAQLELLEALTASVRARVEKQRRAAGS